MTESKLFITLMELKFRHLLTFSMSRSFLNKSSIVFTKPKIMKMYLSIHLVVLGRCVNTDNGNAILIILQQWSLSHLQQNQLFPVLSCLKESFPKMKGFFHHTDSKIKSFPTCPVLQYKKVKSLRILKWILFWSVRVRARNRKIERAGFYMENDLSIQKI